MDVNYRPIDDLIGFYESYAEEVNQEFDIVHGQIAPIMLDELSHTPRRRVWPGDYPEGRLEWTSEKQRRWYWANIGMPYRRRSPGIGKQWRINAIKTAGFIRVTVENPSPAAKWVYGSLGDTMPGRFQQRFHVITGWQRAHETVAYWLDVEANEVERRMRQRFGDLVGGQTTRRRAYTAPRRRR